VTKEVPGFLRARRPEQKQQRHQAILDAARALAERDGVGAVSLAGIAADVGMHKSALLKYFGTREEIFLQLAEQEWRGWAADVTAALADTPATDPTEHVVEALSGPLVARPLFCQLLLHSTLTLEHNVSVEALRRQKAVTMAALDELTTALHRALPDLAPAACFELLATGGIAAAGLWQAAHPPPAVRMLKPQPPLDFGTAVARFIRVYLTGLRAL
jgi:AcrR family transcriptional regulator